MCQGVVSTDSTLSGYWYQKEEVKDECLESNGYVKDCKWWYECDNITGYMISNRFVSYLMVRNHDYGT